MQALQAGEHERAQMLEVTNRHLLKALAERDDMADRLALLTHTDALTGLLNRRTFFARAALEIQRIQRRAAPLSVIVLDIDHFQRINDRYGNAVGDEAIRQLAGCMRQTLREVDVMARFSGEEFVALLPKTGLVPATAVAERLREAIAALGVISPAGPIPVTATLGVAEWLPGETIEATLLKADTVLHEARHGGRDQVCVWRPPVAG
jgi:diguanylate cyclase